MATGRRVVAFEPKRDSKDMNGFNLKEHELTVEEVHRNLPPSALYEHAVLYEKDAHIAENGALVAYSGVKTGPLAKGQARGQAESLGERRLVGPSQYPAGASNFRHQSGACERLSEQP